MKYSLIALTLLMIIACNNKEEADIIIANGIVYSCDSNGTIYEAIAIKDGNIISVGSYEEIAKKYKSKEIINATGKFVYPGFIDAHCHFSSYALNKYMCDLIGTESFDDVLKRVEKYETTNELSWIYGRGWDQNNWTNNEFPNKAALDKRFPDKPVILKRIDGHAILCNQKALELAGINKETTIDGGIIEKKDDQLTGILIDNACTPVEKIIPELPREQGIKYLNKAEQECFLYGITTVVDCGVKADRIRFLDSLYEKEKLQIGNSVLLAQDSNTLKEFVKKGFYKNGQFQINGIKMYADGALGSRGACLLKEYSDQPGHYGLMLSDMQTFEWICNFAESAEIQLCTHAIGDSANRAILRLYSKFLQKGNDKRWRIEHAQVVDSQDYKWFSEYNIIPSVQPTHATSDMPWAINRLGNNRIYSAYSYKTLLRQNNWLPLGTDFPVEQIDPLTTFYAAVVRKDKNGNPPEGFMTEQALSRKEALSGMTLWAAKSVFLEKEKGSIETGKHADIIIMDTDLLNCKENEILNSKVLYTIVKGKIVYNKKGAE